MLHLTFLLPISLISYFHPTKQGIVTAVPISTGNYGKESVTPQISNKLSRNIHLIVPAGITSIPDSTEDQTLLQLEDLDIIVNAGGKTQLPINAYCMESSDGVPDGGSGFKIENTKDPDLLALISQLKQQPVEEDAHQAAVWAITDKHELTYLPNESPEDKTLRNFLSERTGLENKWYELTAQRRIDPERRIVIEPSIINGKLEFDCQPGKVIIEEVRKEDGTLMISNNTNFAPRTTHLKYEFKLTIRGWDKGDYYVLVKTNAGDLARFDFAL